MSIKTKQQKPTPSPCRRGREGVSGTHGTARAAEEGGRPRHGEENRRRTRNAPEERRAVLRWVRAASEPSRPGPEPEPEPAHRGSSHPRAPHTPGSSQHEQRPPRPGNHLVCAAFHSFSSLGSATPLQAGGPRCFCSCRTRGSFQNYS